MGSDFVAKKNKKMENETEWENIGHFTGELDQIRLHWAFRLKEVILALFGRHDLLLKDPT